MPTPFDSCSTRRARRAVAIPVVLLILALGSLGPTATASTRDPPGRFERVPASGMLPGALRSAIDEGSEGRQLARRETLAAAQGSDSAGTPTYLIELLAPLPHTPYRVLQFFASSGPGGGAFGAVTFQFDDASNSNQTYIWEHRAPASSVRVGPRTRRAHLELDSGLATADLAFTPTRRTRRHTFGCDTFFAPEASTVTWTIGRLNGAFSFRPNTAILQTGAESVRAAVEKIVPTRRSCHPPPRRCYRQWNFSFWDGETFVSELKAPPGPQASVDVDAIRFRGGSSNFELDWISWFPLDSDPIERSATGITFDASGAGPFLSGSISFQRSGLHSVRDGVGCRLRTVGYTWSSGAITGNLDAGPWTVSGPALRARSNLYTPT
ncbi:MAG: hypothetical protein ACJ77A_10435 [Actinomycetota bacterium]